MDILKRLNSSAKKMKKEQGVKANPKAEGNMNPAGMGESFASALRGAMDGSESLKGSKSGFLGVEKQSVDVKSYSHSLDDDKNLKK